MDALFLKLLNMSITAGWVILAVILLRLLVKKLPKWLSCCLWVIVGIRLVLPFSIESVFSLLPSAKTIDTAVYTARPYIETGFSAIDNQVNGYLGNHYYEGVTVPTDHFSHIMNILAVIWLIGLAVMLIYSVVSYIRLYRKVSASICLKDNIYYCDDISTPFILGIVRPRIYVSSGMPEEDLTYVAAHENAHLKRKDHLWKPLGFVLLSVYWFNPLVWAAYILLCRDIELACDERVIRDMGCEGKKAYAEALLSYSVQRRMVMTCPLAFGEVGVKDRVKSVLHYKKPAFWVIVVAVIICVFVSIGFLTNPLNAKNDGEQLQEKFDELAERQLEFRIFSCDTSHDLVSPTITLSRKDNSCGFFTSVASSYLFVGTYELTDTGLKLQSDDGSRTYYFDVEKENGKDVFLFDAEKSSPVDTYPDHMPVVDGTIFREVE